jgi:hypothetical protein
MKNPNNMAAISRMSNDPTKNLCTYAETQGKQRGMSGKEINDTEFKILILNTIESKIQVALHHNHKLFHPISGRIIAQQLRQKADAEITSLVALHNEQEHTLINAQEQMKSCAPDKKRQWLRRCIHFAVALIATAEGYFVFEGLRHASFQFVPAAITALSIAACIGLGVHFFAGFILKSNTMRQKIQRYSLILIPSLIFFYIISYLRADAYNNFLGVTIERENIIKPTNISPWILMLLSYIIFVVSLFFSLWIYKSEKEQEEEKHYEAACCEETESQKKMKAFEDRMHEIDRDAVNKQNEALENYEIALANENGLIALAERARQAFIDKYMLFHKASHTPTCFSNPSTFQFTRFFQPPKN